MISDKTKVQDSLLILHIRGLDFLHPEIARELTSQKNEIFWFPLLCLSSLFYEKILAANHIHHLNLVFKEEPCV
jgi:hypothetical protein